MPLRRQVSAGLGAGAFLLLIVASVAVWSSLRSMHAAEERRRAFEHRTSLDLLLSGVREAETTQRGYLLLGDTALLDLHHQRRGDLPHLVANVRKDASGTSERRLVDSLERLVEAKAAELEQTVTLHRDGQPSAALAIVRTAKGQRLMEAIEVLINALVAQELAVVATWDAKLLTADRMAIVTSAAAIVISLVLLVRVGRAVDRTIAQRDAAEAASRESQQHLTSLIEALPVAVFVLDANGKPFYTNSVSKAILGGDSRKDLRVSDLTDAYGVYVAGTNEKYPAERLPVVRALRGEIVYVEDVEIRRADQRVIPLEVRAAPVKDAEGRIKFAVAVFSDIHERLESRAAISSLNAELEARVSELSTLNKELEAFSYSVSHDLRAPVRHISGFARLLEEALGRDMDEQVRHYLERIREGGRHMGALIDDLLQLGKVSRQELIRERCDLNALLRNVVYELREDTRGRDLEWRIARLPAVNADARLLRHVYTNLLSNALKFTRSRARPAIEVGHIPDGAVSVFFVRDNGVGFDPRYADKLFGVFQRLHHADQFEGTGVGLATATRIVQKHGGRMWAESQLDKGATFYFTLEPELHGARSKGAPG